jgi:putative DNA primase/helicase
MKNIDLIREVTLAAADRWPTVLAGLHIDVPDSPRRHTVPGLRRLGSLPFR